jgi:bacillithiol biosynthesis cysteine-adding enzyme BshC
MIAMTSMAAPKIPYQLVPWSQVGGITRLYADFLQGKPEVRPFFGPAFDDPAAAQKLARQLAARTYPRAELYSALADLATEVAAPPEALASLELFRRDGTLVVFAGQQAGLFGGPLYTVYKALTVERWARDLAAQLQMPVVPLFWLSSDDHDFEEVEWVGLPRGRDLEKIRYRPVPTPAGVPVGRIQIDPGIEQVIVDLASALPDSEFKPGVFDALRRAYAPGSRYVPALGRLWYEMFPSSALVFVSPCHPAMSKAAAPMLRRALSEDEQLFQWYRDSSDRLTSLGYHAQVHKSDDQTFLFYQELKRHSIHRQEQDFVWEGSRPVKAAQLLDTMSAHPEFFSPNVLLRPVVQNALFPTLGVVLGPSETAYYAQIGTLHDHFQVPRPLVLPRTSVTVIEPSVAKKLGRHQIDLWALRNDRDREVARSLHASFPSDLQVRFEAAAQKIDSAFEEVRKPVTAFEPTLEGPVGAAAHRARREMEQLAQKAYSAHKRKEEETELQLRRLALQLFPEGGLQERSFNVVYYWARYGPAFLDGLYRHFPAGQRDHVLWEG